jgi:hypothetical protein
MSFPGVWLCLVLALASVSSAHAQEPAYFVTYDHYLEEPGNLEIAVANTTGVPKGDHGVYWAPWFELGYGIKGWWTAELYLEGVTTRRDGSGFTGWRFENRFRPLKAEHSLNPVLYLEYESINEASRIQKELVGTGSLSFESIGILRQKHVHELEGKLILSSALAGWNLSENLIVEKNLSQDEGFEFGYSMGVSRSLGALASGTSCHVCRENFVAGIEAYGGLGTSKGRTFTDTRHYMAPVIAWHVTDRSTLKASTGLGLTEASDRYLVRVGWSFELSLRGHR